MMSSGLVSTTVDIKGKAWSSARNATETGISSSVWFYVFSCLRIRTPIHGDLLNMVINEVRDEILGR